MNSATFNALLTPYFSMQLPKSRSDAAKAIATAYHLANIGQTTTMFAAPMLNADKTILETFIELSLDINFYGSQVKATASAIIASITLAIKEIQAGSKTALKDAQQFISGQVNTLVSSLPAPLSFLGGIISGLVDSILSGIVAGLSAGIDKISEEIYKKLQKLQGIIDSLDVSGIAYAVMATGFSLYWLTATMSPVPPMPPCIAPTGGTTILFPGSPIPLNKDLQETFQSAQSPAQAIIKLYNSLLKHQLTVAGIYTGILPMVPSPIPGPPIPWIGLLNVPLPESKASGSSGTSGTSGFGTAGTSGLGTFGTAGTTGTSGVRGSSGTAGTSGTSGTGSPKQPDITSTFSDLTKEIFNG